MILIGGGISSGKSSVCRLLGPVLSPVLGRTAAVDLDDLHQAVEDGPGSRSANPLEDWLRTRRQAALPCRDFDAGGFGAVVLAGPVPRCRRDRRRHRAPAHGLARRPVHAALCRR